MSYIENLQADLKAAMLKRESDRVRTLRMLVSKLREKKIALMKDLDEVDELAVLKKAAKERQDSMTTYLSANRKDLADIEKSELELIQSYLPPEMDDETIEKIIKKVIADTGASSMADMGRVMGASMKEIAGQADGKRVQIIVRKLLGA
ncbi:MAG: GatB/YqeY domain-containing protein [Candidatus Marinimicrobia bacterium]|nr:GatB/YqeY domain-containing protein [Candidatus Neomarinimicrobiota bacterium]